MSVGGSRKRHAMGDSWRVWSEEAIYVKMKEPGSGQEQLGGIMRLKSATGQPVIRPHQAKS